MRVLLFIIILFTGFHSFSQENETLVLKTYSFEEVTQLQKEEKRPIVIFIHTSWCKYCLAMKKNTFTNQNIIQKLNDNFYFVTFNAETKKNITFNNHTFKFKPTGKNTGTHELASTLTNNNLTYPSIVFLSSKNYVLHTENSFLDPKTLLKILHKLTLKKQ